MCKPTELSPANDSGGGSSIRARQLFFAAASFLLGVWAFIKVNSISGPAFEPIIAACTNPDISVEDFAEKTGYHYYDPKLGLGAFNVLVCLITQFLLELRETPPAGVLVWGGVIVSSLPVAVSNCVAAGRKGAKGPIRYPTVFGLLFQLLGISVIYPMLWVPCYIFSGSKPGVPVTSLRIGFATFMALPTTILTYFVFNADTDSYLWTASAGILGGPLLVMACLLIWTDKSCTMEASTKNITQSNRSITHAYNFMGIVSFMLWSCLINVAYNTYGLELDTMWKEIWAEANASVAFMTIDTGVLYLGVLLLIGYENGWKALKTFLLTPLLGPGAACCLALKGLENDSTSALLSKEKKEV